MEFSKAIRFALRKYDPVIERHVETFMADIVRPRLKEWQNRVMAEAQDSRYSVFYGHLDGNSQMELRQLFLTANLKTNLLRVFNVDGAAGAHSIITDLPELRDLFDTVYRDVADLWVDVFMTHIGQYDIRYEITEHEIQNAFNTMVIGRSNEEYFHDLIKQAAEKIISSLLAVLIRAGNAAEARAGARGFVFAHTNKLERDIFIGVQHKLFMAKGQAIEAMNSALSSGINVIYKRLESNG